MSSNRHREAILARRALYLSTALTALGCPSRETPPTDPIETAATARADKRKKRKTALPENTPWKEVMAKAPPLDVPASAPERERQHLENLRKDVERKYEVIRAVWIQTPGCDPAASSCRDWKAVADAAQKMYRATEGMSFGACGGANGTTGSVVARRRAHNQFIGALVAQAEAHLEKLAIHFGPDGASEWGVMLKEAKKPPPHPCLSPCPMPVLQDIVESVPFEHDDATLRESDSEVARTLASALATQKAQAGKAVLVVRGHADSAEADPAKLAAERARAVAAWLVTNGLAAADVTTRALGSDLLVEKSGAQGGAARNRRVDFEVVPR